MNENKDANPSEIKFKMTYRSCGMEKDFTFKDADVEYRSTIVEEYDALTEEQVVVAASRIYDVNSELPELDKKHFTFIEPKEFEELNADYKTRFGLYHGFVDTFRDFVKSGKNHFTTFCGGDDETITVVPVGIDAK